MCSRRGSDHPYRALDHLAPELKEGRAEAALEAKRTCDCHALGSLRHDSDTAHGQAHRARHFIQLQFILPSGVQSAEKAIGIVVPPGDVLSYNEPTHAQAWAESCGFAIIETAANGSCGLYAIACFLGLPRTPSNWLSLRLKISHS